MLTRTKGVGWGGSRMKRPGQQGRLPWCVQQLSDRPTSLLGWEKLQMGGTMDHALDGCGERKDSRKGWPLVDSVVLGSNRLAVRRSLRSAVLCWRAANLSSTLRAASQQDAPMRCQGLAQGAATRGVIQGWDERRRQASSLGGSAAGLHVACGADHLAAKLLRGSAYRPGPLRPPP